MAGRLKEFDFYADLRPDDRVVVLGPPGAARTRLMNFFIFTTYGCTPDSRMTAFVDNDAGAESMRQSYVNATPHVGVTAARLQEACRDPLNTAVVVFTDDGACDSPELRAAVADAYRCRVLLLVSAQRADAPTVRLDLTRLVVVVPGVPAEALLQQLPLQFAGASQLREWLAALGPDDALVMSADDGDAFVIYGGTGSHASHASRASSVAPVPGSGHTSDAEAFQPASSRDSADDGTDHSSDDDDGAGDVVWESPQAPAPVNLPRFRAHEQLLPRDTVLVLGARGVGKTTLLAYLLYSMRRHLGVATAFSMTPSARKAFAALMSVVHAKLAVNRLKAACSSYVGGAAVLVDANHALTTSTLLRETIRNVCQGRVLYLVATSDSDTAAQLVQKDADFVVLFPPHNRYPPLQALPVSIYPALRSLQQYEALVFDRRAFEVDAEHYLFKVRAPPTLPHFTINKARMPSAVWVLFQCLVFLSVFYLLWSVAWEARFFESRKP
jgi:hypothetical protein